MTQSDLYSLTAELEEIQKEWTRRERIKRLRDGTFALDLFKPLLEPHTFKAAYGGRGSAKSYFFADLHLHYALEHIDAYRALCLRQIQKSIRESLKFLLEQRMQFWGIGDKFGVFESKIETPGGGEFVFHGLEGQTAESIKSFEGFHVADIEEGQMVKQRPLDLLVPTIIRKAGAEIWARWNPRHDTDPVDLMFRQSPPPDCISIRCGYKDNPYLNEETLRQIESDYEKDPEKSAHIWGGEYEIIGEGAYFAKQIAQAEREGRVGAFPYDDKLNVKSAWDIGVDDYTAVWYLQEHWRDGLPRVRVIDYYETSGDGAQLIASQAVHGKPYKYAGHHFPHDVMVREWGAGARSRYDTLNGLGVMPILVGVAQGPEERINAVRELLPICEFDNNQNVQLGLKRLRRYQRKLNETLGVYQGPLHDENSHGADAFGEYAINSPLVRAAKAQKPKGFNDYVSRQSAPQEDLGRV